MAYTENKSIDWLTAITPTTDDLVVTMDQAEVWVAKSSTLASIYNLFKTTYDTLYAKYLWDADFYKYSITTSESGGNLTVALLNYAGATPSATAPVKIQIGGVIRTITSALSLTKVSWTSYLNLGSAELATKEVDLFVYLRWDTGANVVCLDVSRIPNATRTGDFTQNDTGEKWYFVSSFAWSAVTDVEVNIWRFAATLSGGAGYTWSIGTSLILNQPTLQTRYLDYTPAGAGYTAGWAKYRIDWNNVNVIIDSTANITGNITVPFTCTNTVDNQFITSAGTAVLPKNSATITVATNPQNISWFYWI